RGTPHRRAGSLPSRSFWRCCREPKGTFDGGDTRFPQPHSLPSTDMAAVNRVYEARLAGMVGVGPDGEAVGRVRDVGISISVAGHQPRVLGLVVELLTRRRIFVPILRVTAIEPSAVTLATGNVSLRRFSKRPNEVLVLGEVIETRVRVDDPDLPELAGIDVVVVDLGIEQTRTRDWVVTKV